MKMASALVVRMWKWWQVRKQCFHHDRLSGESWINSALIDMGMRKMFWYDKCGRTWYT